jgi:acyl phosphate:glycerol-3-phosphate acyltransferase
VSLALGGRGCYIESLSSDLNDDIQTRKTGCSSAWLEHCVRDAGVAGSNPVTPINTAYSGCPEGKLVLALLTVFGYLFGAIPVGVLVGRAWGFDPRAVGSGNIGTTNVARAGGTIPAALTFMADVLKGVIPVELARLVMGSAPSALGLVACATFVGSIASVFLKFRGGRGVATSLGVWLALAPKPIGIVAGVFVVILVFIRIVSLASLIAALALPPTVAALNCPAPYLLLAIGMTALVLLRHSENIARLIRGEEPSIRRSAADKV